MRDYIILNGVNSNTITGLLISTLPPITKPKIRTQTEEIDGRDGDIVTKLGYSAYDKEIEIGLYGDFDIDDVIAYFNSEGTVTFSNEPDKFYNYQIIDQIDYEKLIRFKKAKVKMHVQPFKYPLEETPVEITNQYVNNEAEEMDLDNTKEAPMKIDLKGNTSQATTTGKNLLSFAGITNDTVVGITRTINQETITLNGTTTGAGNIVAKTSTGIILKAGTYTGSITTSGSYNRPNGDVAFYLRKYNTISVMFGKSLLYMTTNGQYSSTFTLTEDTEVFLEIYANASNITFNNYVCKFQIEKGSTATEYEPYTGGIPAPNPEYPQDIHVVSGDNSIKVEGKNLAKEEFDSKYYLTGTGNNRTVTNAVYKLSEIIKVQPNTTYTISGTFTDFADNVIRIAMFDSMPTTGSTSTQYLASASSPYTFTTDTNTTYILIWNSGGTGDTTINKLQLELGNQATTYEAYIGESYPVNLPVENLFDKGNANTLNCYVNGASKTIVSYNNAKSLYIPIQSSKTYTISKILSARFVVGTCVSTPANNVACSVIREDRTGTSITITSGASDKFLCVFYYLSGTDTLTEQQILDSIQIEVGSKANSYTQFGTTPIELCKIGNYQDYIYKDSDKWYVHKEIGKYVITSFDSKSGTTNNIMYNTTVISDILKPPVGNVRIDTLSNYFESKSANQIYANNITGIGVNITGTLSCGFTLSSTLTTLELANTWLSTHNTIVYYPLATPTTTEITDETLIAQLNALANASSYDPVTHITQNANDKPFILNATALQQGSGEATVNNEGNIYSKPTLDIEGSGTVGIYLDGNQIFSIDLSNSSECVIDTTQLEAYNPTTSELMNRQVTGDYSNFKLNAGDNQVQATGEITKVTISNYSRWL